MKLLSIAVAVLCCVKSSNSANSSNSVKLWIKDLVKERHYDSYISPTLTKILSSNDTKYKVKPTEVKVRLFIESIGNYRSQAMDYELDLYIIEFWNDVRLEHNFSRPIAINDADIIMKALWLPDLYFTNSKSARYTYVTVPNFRFLIQRNGDVRYSTRVSLKVSCHMMFYYFPIDVQACDLIIQPYMSDNTILDVKWDEKPLSVSSKIRDADLALIREKIETNYCDGSYETDCYSCLKAVFHLRREIGSSLIATFIPTFFIVMISWIAFWIDPSSAPARVGLAITTLLTFSTMSAGIRQGLPPVSYAKALDYWLFLCLFFLFAALLEFAVVNTYLRQSNSFVQKRKEAKLSMSLGQMPPTMDRKMSRAIPVHMQSIAANGEGMTTNGITFVGISSKMAKQYYDKAIFVDRISRVAFPLLFALCVIIYCLVVTSKNQLDRSNERVENSCPVITE